jgi:hypothetical protein
MKNRAFLMFLLFFLASSAATAQFVSPVPVTETEMRDKSSVKIRSIELERVKRDAGKKGIEKIGRASVNNFLEIKADFEKIQKLESEIITVYRTGREINFARIAALSAEINQSAARLRENLFAPQNKDSRTPSEGAGKPEKEALTAQPIVNLIVELDDAIGAFVVNPIFLTPKKAADEDRARAEFDLGRIIKFSAALKREAEKNAPAKN